MTFVTPEENVKALSETLDGWLAEGVLSETERNACLELSRQQWTAGAPPALVQPPPGIRDAEAERAWRRARLLSAELPRWAAAQCLSAASAYRCQALVQSEFARLRDLLAQSRSADPVPAGADEPPIIMADPIEARRPAPMETPVLAAAVEPTPPSEPLIQRLIETLLDPRTLQWFLAAGAGLLATGLAVWLWSVGLFSDPRTAAVILGVASLGVMGAGVWVAQRTQHQTAGRALAMLGCLVAPLNLWFYEAQGLIPLEEGGRLWAPALVLCVLYAAVARALKHPMFVYALIGGVTLTGFLFLADAAVARFWEVTAPSAFLIALGVACIHAESAFPEDDGPFGRKRFGLAFFRGGQTLLFAGVTLLAGAQVAIFQSETLQLLGNLNGSSSVTDWDAFGWTSVLLAGLAAYGFGYARWGLGHRGYGYFSVACGVWLLGLVLRESGLTLSGPMVVLAMAIGSIVFSVLEERFSEDEQDSQDPWASATLGAGAGAVLAAAAVLGSLWFGVRLGMDWPEINGSRAWMVALASGATAVASGWCGWRAAQRGGSGDLAAWTFAMTTTRLLAVTCVLAGFGQLDSAWSMPLLMATPVLSAILVANAPESHWRRILSDSCLWEGGILLIGSPLWVMAEPTNLIGQLVFYGVAAVLFRILHFQQREGGGFLFAVAMCGLVWRVLATIGFASHAPWMVLGGLGAGVLAFQRWASRSAAPAKQSAEATTTVGLTQRWLLSDSPSAHAAVALSTAAAAGMCGTDALASLRGAGEATWSLAPFLMVQGALAFAVSRYCRDDNWRRVHTVLAAFAAAALGWVVYRNLQFGVWESVEAMLAMAGVLLTAEGVAQRLRRNAQAKPVLAFGSSLLALPPLAVLIGGRFFGYASTAWAMTHEIGVLAVALVLIVVGIAVRSRWVTLLSSAVMAIYVVSLVAWIRVPDYLANTATLMMVGGGVLFGGAALLSIFRDRLQKLPEKMRQGTGVFQVMRWE